MAPSTFSNIASGNVIKRHENETAQRAVASERPHQSLEQVHEKCLPRTPSGQHRQPRETPPRARPCAAPRRCASGRGRHIFPALYGGNMAYPSYILEKLTV